MRHPACADILGIFQIASEVEFKSTSRKQSARERVLTEAGVSQICRIDALNSEGRDNRDFIKFAVADSLVL